jgi:hypothetical protein
MRRPLLVDRCLPEPSQPRQQLVARQAVTFSWLVKAALADRLLAIGRDTAPRLREPFRTADHGDLLYDERGLPA